MKHTMLLLILGSMVAFTGCKRTHMEMQSQIEGNIRRAIGQGQPAENIEKFVLQADDQSKAAAIGAWELMRRDYVPANIAAPMHYDQTPTSSNTPNIENLKVLEQYRISVLQVLIRYGINLNHHWTGQPFILWPVHDVPSPGLLTFLLEHGYDPNLDGNLLGLCAYPGQSIMPYDRKRELIKILLEHGANPNAMGVGRGLPVLHQFITYNNYHNPYLVEVVQLLLEAGADVTVVDESGRTALDLAIYFQDTCPNDNRAPKVVESLKGFGAKRAGELYAQSI
jgi:hypothetical protein